MRASTHCQASILIRPDAQPLHGAEPGGAPGCADVGRGVHAFRWSRRVAHADRSAHARSTLRLVSSAGLQVRIPYGRRSTLKFVQCSRCNRWRRRFQAFPRRVCGMPGVCLIQLHPRRMGTVVVPNKALEHNCRPASPIRWSLVHSYSQCRPCSPSGGSGSAFPLSGFGYFHLHVVVV
jgi:hypothetical protein